MAIRHFTKRGARGGTEIAFGDHPVGDQQMKLANTILAISKLFSEQDSEFGDRRQKETK